MSKSAESKNSSFIEEEIILPVGVRAIRKFSRRVTITSAIKKFIRKLGKNKQKLPITKEVVNGSISDESIITEVENCDISSDIDTSFKSSDTVTETLFSEYESAEELNFNPSTVEINSKLTVVVCNEKSPPVHVSNNSSVLSSLSTSICSFIRGKRAEVQSLPSTSSFTSLEEESSEHEFNIAQDKTLDISFIDEKSSKRDSVSSDTKLSVEHTSCSNKYEVESKCPPAARQQMDNAPVKYEIEGISVQENCNSTGKNILLIPLSTHGDQDFNSHSSEDGDGPYYDCEQEETVISRKFPFRNYEKHWEPVGEKNMGRQNDVDFVSDYDAELREIINSYKKSNQHLSKITSRTLTNPKKYNLEISLCGDILLSSSSEIPEKYLPGCMYERCPEGAIENFSPEESKSVFHYKILLLGEKKSGKTCFLQRYTRKYFSKNYQPSYGVEFAKMTLKWEENMEFKLLFCDVAGEELAWPLKRSIYHLSRAAFIIHDANQLQSLPKALDHWKKDLQIKGPLHLPNGDFIPLILLLNKCDEAEPDNALVDELCSSYGYCAWYNISAKENINLDTAVYSIITKIVNGDSRVKNQK